jgi:hypothetical protein
VTPPSLASYNARAQAAGLTTGGGQPLRFVLPDEHNEGYEERAFRCGEVITRPDNWHDAYNAEVWLEFPRAKASLNRRHLDALRAARAAGETARGRVRDRLTQFDECGVVITGLPGELWQALREHRWREVFVDHREEMRAARFLIFGHASRDLLRAPFPGICGKALWLETTTDALAEADELLARRLTSADFQERWPVLPLLGIPGITADNEDPSYYDDTRQFRPLRTA